VASPELGLQENAHHPEGDGAVAKAQFDGRNNNDQRIFSKAPAM
jgi:hypothetical protein